MEIEKANEEILKLQEKNTKLSSQIMSLQEQMESILRKNTNYINELSEKSNKIFEMQKTIEEYKKQKKIYDDFNQLFPNKNPEEILKEIEIQNEGHHQLFSDYEDLRLELKRIKIEKENYEKLNPEFLILYKFDFKKMKENSEIIVDLNKYKRNTKNKKKN